MSFHTTTYAWCQQMASYTQQIHKPNIAAIRWKRMDKSHDNYIANAAIFINQQSTLALVFDEIGGNVEEYYAKIVHCNWNWEPSSLSSIDFMDSYNEFYIDNYIPSHTTYMPYVHYEFIIPPVNITGNYLLIVYKNDHESDITLSRRFMVYNNKIAIKTNDDSYNLDVLAPTIQPFSFDINYAGVTTTISERDIRVVVRQNRRWDNAIFNIPPQQIKEDIQQITYRLSQDNGASFDGGNEYRWFDIRSLDYPGEHTNRMDRSTIPFHLWVDPDKNRTNEVYAKHNDQNGGYYVQNLDAPDSKSSSHFLSVTFTLQNSFLTESQVYVVGGFNDWSVIPQHEMKYIQTQQAYQLTLTLKQGWYDYQYTVVSKKYPHYYIEGSFFETENEYDVLVYNRDPYLGVYLLEGFTSFHINPH